ncbi:hypothetical protein RJ640_000813 [Escallonia rubra]|uniref:Remorin C-terminal domain-containing protein n=1 Tax=Escallonia rubra TaxID=112253 RepID=A0AA88UM34_9ASTE|nr:hypothetical protein RJ640_000813 [Escallonia rubra]
METLEFRIASSNSEVIVFPLFIPSSSINGFRSAALRAWKRHSDRTAPHAVHGDTATSPQPQGSDGDASTNTGVPSIDQRLLTPSTATPHPPVEIPTDPSTKPYACDVPGEASRYTDDTGTTPVKAERLKSRAREKFTNKLAAARRIAEEKRANAEAKLNEKSAGLDDNLLSSLSQGSNRIQSNDERVFGEFNMMELCVSVPSETATMFAATDIADPLLDPHGDPVWTYGFYIFPIEKVGHLLH